MLSTLAAVPSGMAGLGALGGLLHLGRKHTSEFWRTVRVGGKLRFAKEQLANEVSADEIAKILRAADGRPDDQPEDPTAD